MSELLVPPFPQNSHSPSHDPQLVPHFFDHENNNEGTSGIKNMEHLETQVSDLRSFLPGALSLAASTSTSNANSRPAAHMAGVVIGPGASTAATTPRHPSQSAGSSVSAVGSNSAHPSPLAFVPNHNAQPARNHGPSVSTTGPVSAHHSTTNGGGGGGGRAGSSGVAVTAGVKRKLNDNASDDSSQQRQQRSKRNRVSGSCHLDAIWLADRYFCARL